MERQPKVTTILENWNRMAANLSKEELDKIGELWITEILDCDENIISRFKEDFANSEIGLKHAGVTDYQANSRKFWEEINKIAPNIAPSEHLEYLIENDCNGDAAWSMICVLDGLNTYPNSLITKLVNNALLYK